MENTKESNNSVMFLGYNRPVTGREIAASQTIESLVKYLEKAIKSKLITSYDTVSLTVHGGDLNGFILIRGNRKNLDEMRASEEFDELAIKAHMVMTGVSVLTGVYGEAVTTRRLERLNKLALANFTK